MASSLIRRFGSGLASQMSNDSAIERIFAKNMMGHRVSALDAAPSLRRGSLA